jgi:ribosomal protein S18 acetylase RimI-like enzyme
MRIARLGPEDVGPFLELRRQALEGDPGAFRYTTADDRRAGEAAWRERLGRDYVAGAFGEGRLIGVGGFARLAGDKLDHKGLVWGMYVRPEARGRGVADALMRALVEHARGRVRLLQLTVMADNARARAFYERHGFRTYAIEPQAVRQGGELRDEALMWLPLVAG